MDEPIDLFVPGRVCLFGEHSDWAGSYRRFNSALPPGRVLLAGVNQGIYARVRGCKDALVVRSTLPDGSVQGPTRIPMDPAKLLDVARAGGFFSYAAGVAYYMKTFYHVDGVEIDNYKTDLPVRKGLSSSAAFCVLAARAFNRVYDLRLTIRAEMEAAYQGEILTPSRCGRMDQGCAFGRTAVRMVFDGDRLEAEPIPVGAPFHFLIADLNGAKDTVRILAALNTAYPFATDEKSERLQAYFSSINPRIVGAAEQALQQGEPDVVGRLMTEAQAAFDQAAIPLCPDQLTAPKLHAVLKDPKIRPWIFGAKGVGSQGDGCVQFLARSPQARDRLAQYLAHEYGMDSFPLDLTPPKAVRKAVIPVAGFGTRMFPASKAIKKELFPVVGPDGVARPALLAIIEEAIEAGIEEIALVVRPEDAPVFHNFFSRSLPPRRLHHLPERLRPWNERIEAIGKHITTIPQEAQEGFGHAVYCAREWVGDEPFLLLLGDHLYRSDTPESCARQLLTAFEKNGKRSMVGVYVAGPDEVEHYGAVTGAWCDPGQRLLEIAEFAEKPSLDYARNNLVAAGIGGDRFLCVNGQYVLSPAIFEYLEKQIAGDIRENGEIQLTTALEAMRRAEGVFGYRVRGRHFDIGLPSAYVATLQAFAAQPNSAAREEAAAP